MPECNPETNTCNAHCCRIMVIKPQPLTRELIDYYKKRGCEIEGDHVLLPCVCPLLNQEENKCSVHGTDKKPFICKRFTETNTRGFYIPRDCVYHPKYKG